MGIRHTLPLALLLLSAWISPATAQSTSGDCSPVIVRTDGDVTVNCGSKDLDVNFLISVIQAECRDFDESLETWGQDTKDWGGWFRTAYFPRFNQGLVQDIRDNSATIYQYDPSSFAEIYRMAIAISEDQAAAEARLSSDRRHYLPGQALKYLIGVGSVCSWFGHDPQIGKWLADYDDDRTFLNNGLAETPIAVTGPLNAAQSAIVTDTLIGDWCAPDNNRYYRFFDVEDGFLAFEWGSLENNRFEFINSGWAQVTAVNETEVSFVSDNTAGRGLVRFGDSFEFNVSTFELGPDQIIYRGYEVFRSDEPAAQTALDRTYSRCIPIVYDNRL